MSAEMPAASADLAWFFDVDGTVVEIAHTPEAVILDPAIGAVLVDLHRRSGGALALISGRPIADVDGLFPGSRLPTAGEHGNERRDGSGRTTRSPVQTAALSAAREELAKVALRHPDLRLEVKRHSLALHYRQAPQLGGFVYRTMRALQARHGDTFRLQPGKRVLELLPADHHKGDAVDAFMAEPPFAGRVPVFVGDDLTDEYAFAVVNRRGGHSVKVGVGPTVAQWRLPDVQAVRQWLEDGRR